MPFVINRIPSEEFGISVRSVGILTRTGTHLKLIRSCHNCNRQVADHFHPQIGGGSLFFFGLRPDTPPPTLGSGSTSRYPLVRAISLYNVDLSFRSGRLSICHAKQQSFVSIVCYSLFPTMSSSKSSLCGSNLAHSSIIYR